MNAQETMKERMARVRAARGGKRASVETTVTSDQEFLARNINRRESSTSNVEGGEGAVEHNRPSTVVMWKPSPQGYFPRTVSVTAIEANLEAGWRSTCPECNGQHSADPNSCPNREPIATTRCPVCNKQLWDNMAKDSREAPDDDDDPNMIRFDNYENTTPRSRLELQLRLHMWVRHPQQAMMRGFPSLPTALAEMVAESRPV